VFLVVLTSAVYAAGSALLAILSAACKPGSSSAPTRRFARWWMIVSIVSLGIQRALHDSFILLPARTGPLNQFLMGLTGAAEAVCQRLFARRMIPHPSIEYTPAVLPAALLGFPLTDAAFERPP